MATLEEFEVCYREVEAWHEANFQSLNEAEKVQYHQASRNFQATRYYYGVTRTERDSLKRSLRKFYERIWLYGLGLLAVFWGLEQIVQIVLNPESDPDNIWRTLAVVGFIAFIVVTLLEIKVTQLDATVTLLERDIMALGVWQDLSWSLIQHENRLRDDLKNPKEIPTSRIVNLIDYIIRAQILANIKGDAYMPPIGAQTFISGNSRNAP